MLILAVLAASLLTCSSQPDSAGTKFIFGYIRDANRDISNQLLSVTVLNANTFDCVVSIQYREDYDETKNPLVTKNFNVPATNMTEIPIPSWYGWLYDSGGMQDDRGPWQLISANSSCPVTLIANNHDNATLQEDSYLVLPTKWANSVYAFTLPPASDNQNQHITIIPTESDVKGVLTAGSDPLAFTAKVNGPTVYFMTPTTKSQSMTYRIESDIGGPILILAGVTCAGKYTACDHAAFMPQPMLRPLCTSNPPYAEDHPTSISNITSFYANIPQYCYSQNMTVSSQGPVSKQYSLSDSPQTPLLSFDSSFGTAVNMHVDQAPINVIRYHDMSGMGKQGAFIDTVASTNQFFTGNSSFFTKNDRDTIEVICVAIVCLTMTIDGNKITSYNPAMTRIAEIEGVNYYAFVVTVPTKGFHLIYSTADDPYVYYVIGRNDHSMYGYIGGVNMPVYPNITSPATTTSGPTTASTPTVKTSTSSSSSSSPSSTRTSSSSSTPSTTKPTTQPTSKPVTAPSTSKPTTNSPSSSSSTKPTTKPPTAASSSSTPPPTTPSTRTSSGSSTPSTSRPTTQPTSKPVTSSSTAKPITSSSTPSTSSTSKPPPTTASTATSSPSTSSRATSPSTSTVTSAPSSTPSTSPTRPPTSTSTSPTNTPTPTSTLPNRLTTSTLMTTNAQTLPSSPTTKITTRSSAPPVRTSTTSTTTTSSSYSFSSFSLATLLATCLWFSI